MNEPSGEVSPRRTAGDVEGESLCESGYAAKSIGLKDERNRGPLLSVGGEVNPSVEQGFEGWQPAVLVQGGKLKLLPLVDSHDVVFIEEDETIIERAMKRGRQCYPVLNIIATPMSPDRQDMGCVNKAQLHSGDCAPMAIGCEDRVSECAFSCELAQPSEHPLSRLRKLSKCILRYGLKGRGLCEQLVHLGSGTMPVTFPRARDVVGGPVRTDTDRYLIIRLAVKPETVLKRSMEAVEVNLHGGRAGREYSVSLYVEPGKELTSYNRCKSKAAQGILPVAKPDRPLGTEKGAPTPCREYHRASRCGKR